jgi:protein-lysine N-methyltransferase EEF2KMT
MADKVDKMDRLPPIAPAFRSYDYSYPRSLVLFLQCAPHTVVLTAFQADCESRDIPWCSTKAQDLAVEWFLQHPVARKYPPRRRMLRALLKAYITSIEEQRVAERIYASGSSEDEAVQLELMEAYIELSVGGSEDPRETEMSFKTFFNPYVGGSDSPPMYATTAPVPAPPTTSMLVSPLVHLTAFNSSPSQLNAPRGGFKFSTMTATPADAHGTPASVAVATACQPPRSMSEPNHPMAPLRVITFPDSDDLLPMVNVRATSPVTPPQSPFGSSHTPSPQLPAPQLAVDKVMEQFCAVRVSSEQFSNVGLSLWPAAFVLVQLLAQELKGQTHLLSDVLGLPRTPSSAVCNSSGTSMPPLSAPHKIFTSPIPTPPASPPVGARSKRGSSFIGAGGSSSSGGSNVSAVGNKPHSSQLRILELGAGVGLTPVFLHHMEEYRQHVSTFMATDYQETIIDNIKFNFKENGITAVDDFTAAKRGLEGDGTPPFHRATTLDWMNHLENEGLFMENGVDVVLAADCIYDVDAIPGLVDTIHLALTAEDVSSYLTSFSRPTQTKTDLSCSVVSSHGNGSSNSSSFAGAPPIPAPQKQRCCIVVQTHRQNSTMQAFFSAVRKFAQVRSYTLVRQPIGSLNLSQDGSGIDGGCVPLGSWDKQSAMLNPDRVVCALRRDVVLEDGSLGSRAHRSASDDHHTRHDHNDSVASNPIGSSPGRPVGRTHSRTSRPTAPHNPPAACFGKDCPSLTPLHSSRSSNSMDSRISFSRSSSAAVMEAAEALLADEMIGPFYTTMAGLIGVHIITLKPTKKVTR